MQFILMILLSILIKTAVTDSVTADFITSNGYPVEEHKVITTDGYILTIYRIPHSPKLHTPTQNSHRPVILLQHGFVLTSDAWVLSEADSGLAYLLADAGCDVWLGNQRGNTYAREHLTLSADERPFWNFSWHEIGHYDLAAMIDYINLKTHTVALHYIGYSQGTSVLLVLLATRPSYSKRVKSAHLLAPVAYMTRMQQPLAKLGRFGLGLGTAVANTLGYREVLNYAQLRIYKSICAWVCSEGSVLQFVCSKVYRLIGGPGASKLKGSLIGKICETHPAGASTKQILHFLQVYKSGTFHHFDYGHTRNLELYQQVSPPAYNITNIASCISLYYSHNDYMSAAEDVKQLASALPCAELKRMPDDWNHYDYLWSNEVKEVLNEHIIEKIKNVEKL